MKNFREFGISSWAIDNRTAIFLLTIVIVIVGTVSYIRLPKENFPEVQWPVIYVSVPYPGTSPADIEQLVNKKIEKEVQGVKGIKTITSTAIQDFGSVFVEFETDVDIPEAKRNVQEAVDRAQSELPSDLPNDPRVIDINLSEIPIMFINLSGPYDNVALKSYAEDLQEELENEVEELLRVDIVGALEQEMKVEVDLYKMQAAGIGFRDIENAISGENVIISGGEIDMASNRIAVRVDAELGGAEELRNLVLRNSQGRPVNLRDIATVTDGFRDRESYARLDGEPVITLNVIKKAGKNLIEAAEDVRIILAEMEETQFPESLSASISADQSVQTRNTLNELFNTIIIGFILVTLVLMFFMGVRDALFVGLAVPLSSLIAFFVISFMGLTMNLVVLFSFILAMGIVVDNAIVVIENTFRIFNEEGLPIVPAAKKAAGEVIGPVFSGTLTTVAPFLPLLFWPGSIGEFMKFLPITMIVTLFASLFVAYVINPVFAVAFMKRTEDNQPTPTRNLIIYSVIMAVVAGLCYLAGSVLFGNLMLFMIGFVWLNAIVLRRVIAYFQNRAIPSMKRGYRDLLNWIFTKNRHRWVLVGTVGGLLLMMMWLGANPFKVVLFPEADPNFVYVYNQLPVGTDVEVTDSVTSLLERRVYEVIGEDNPLVKSVVTNVAIGAGDANSFASSGAKSNQGKITVEFVEAKYRGDASTSEIMADVRENVRGIPGTQVTVDKEANGPPTGAAVEVELTSEDFDQLTSTARQLLVFLNEKNVPGVEELKWDMDAPRQEIIVDINREKASELGVSSAQIGSTLRTAIYGSEVSKFRPENSEDEYPIYVRLSKPYRDDLNALLNLNISFRDAATGKFRSVPISAVADLRYEQAYGSINRTDLEKSIKIQSNVLDGFNPTEVNQQIANYLNDFRRTFDVPSTLTMTIGGEQEDQAEQSEFLAIAFGASILFIFLILVIQFNSMIDVMIILSQVVLSVIGALIGVKLLGQDFSIIMGGTGLVALAGIVVNNGIILLDFIKQMEREGAELRTAVIEGSAVRFTPVLLTASSTVLGLVPLAVSMNINFETLIARFDPQLFFGGDSAAFWGPLSVTIISGLSFATLITLVIVPILYFSVHRINNRLVAWVRGRNKSTDAVDPFERVDNSSEDYEPHLNGNGSNSTAETPSTEDVDQL